MNSQHNVQRVEPDRGKIAAVHSPEKLAHQRNVAVIPRRWRACFPIDLFIATLPLPLSVVCEKLSHAHTLEPVSNAA